MNIIQNMYLNREENYQDTLPNLCNCIAFYVQIKWVICAMVKNYFGYKHSHF